MTAADIFEVCFWGVRGGIACPGPDTVRYGGNTACIAVRCGGDTLIFDAGTGIRPLGAALIKHAPVAADIFFSHTGFERISGVPFFAAAYNPKNTFRFWANQLPGGKGVHGALTRLMADPVFPVPIEIMAATLEFVDFGAGETLQPTSDIRVRTAQLNRSIPVTGYRVEWQGKSLCYVSDLVAGSDGTEPAVLALLDNADLAIVNLAQDASDSADWHGNLGLCDKAAVKTCVISHHDPDHDDAALDAIAAEAERLRPGTVVAREGLTITL
ncbi:MAG: MBL fold metallo-hydrolase [Proteobacteria bacterium]|nr:MBL fold metallo-hydrolase [Pseudomonadota bacterium]